MRRTDAPMNLVDVTFIGLGLTLATALLVPRTSVPAPIVFAGVGIGVGAAWHLVPSTSSLCSVGPACAAWFRSRWRWPRR